MAVVGIGVEMAGDDAAAKIGEIEAAIVDAGEASEQQGESVSGFGDAIGTGLKASVAIGVAALTVLVGALVGVGSAAFGYASDIHDAQNRIQTTLGTTAERAKEMGGIVEDVFVNNFGGSIGEVQEALVTVERSIGRVADVSDSELQRATENAFMLRDAFELDLSESTSAAAALMEQFGLSSDEAFDFITTGMQKGLNSSDDFLDTIKEYANQFANADATADEFFSVLETGLQSGVLGTDKAADLFKEFTLRVSDGSDRTREALEALSSPTEGWVEKIESGQISAVDAFQQIKDRISDLDDPIEQARLATELFGTQFEDLGLSGFLAIDTMAASVEDMAGATDGLSVQYNNLGDVVEGFKRRGLAAIRPIGDILLDLANRLMPHVEVAFEWIETRLPGMINTAVSAFNQLFGFLSGGADIIGSIFSGDSLPDFDLWGWLQPKLQALFDGAVAWVASADWGSVGSQIGTLLFQAFDLWLWAQEKLHSFYASFAAWFVSQDWGAVANTVLTAIGDALTGFWAIAEPRVSTWWADFSAWFASIDWGQLGYDVAFAVTMGLAQFWSLASTALEGWWVNIKDWFASIDWGQLALDLVNGIIAGIQEYGPMIYEAVADLVDGIIGGARDALEARSPSAKAEDLIALPYVQGIAGGIRKNLGLVTAAADNLTSAALGASIPAPQPAIATVGATSGPQRTTNNITNNNQQNRAPGNLTIHINSQNVEDGIGKTMREMEARGWR